MERRAIGFLLRRVDLAGLVVAGNRVVQSLRAESLRKAHISAASVIARLAGK